MSEYQIETRRRSRSKTPFLRSSIDQETSEEGHVQHQSKKKTNLAPSVQTIVEEVVEVTSSSSSPSSPTTVKNTHNQTPLPKSKTSDYSSEDQSPESMQRRKTTTSSTTTTIVTKSKQIFDGVNSVAATSTPKSKSFLENFTSQFTNLSRSMLGSKEVAQNEINSEFERSQQETSRNNSKNRSFSGIFGSSFATAADGKQDDVSAHLAYLEYKRAGEYWNKTPKTDYTYSELSPHRRELAPGVIAMPNMSRRSLDNHHDRINYMVQRNPMQEEYIRRRYEATKYAQPYDSGDEVDYDSYKRKIVKESWWKRIVTAIVTTFTTITSAVTFDDSDVISYRTKSSQTKRRGFFGTIANGLLSVVRNVYLWVSSILYVDTWLLQSSSTGKNKKRFLLLLLLLLPLLLLGGLYYYLYPNEPFPPNSFTELTLTLPALPKIDMSEYINEEQYKALKMQANERFEDFRTWTDDYLLYLKTLTQNVVDEGRKLFQRDEHYERV